MDKRLSPTLDYLVGTEDSRLAALVAAIEYRVVKQTALVVNLYQRCVGRDSTCTLLNHLVLYAVGQHLNTFLLGVLGEEFLTSLAVGAVSLLQHLALYGRNQALSHHLCRVNGHQAVLASGTANETSHEVSQ